MNPELNKVSPEDLARLRIELIRRAADMANDIIDNSLNTSSVTAETSTLRQDLEHAHRTTEESVKHFNGITDRNLKVQNTSKNGSNDGISSLDDYRAQVSAALDNKQNTEGSDNVVPLNNRSSGSNDFFIPEDRVA